MLSESQNKAFCAFRKKKSIFVTGPGGSGKSYLIKEMKNYADKKNLRMYITALTGSAAKLIGGTTIHHFTGIIPEKTDEYNLFNISRNDMLKERIKQTQILIIDEVSMMSEDLFDLLYLIFTTVRENDLWMGGIQLVLLGDFYQLPPISKTNIRWCFESYWWNQLLTIQLDSSYRQQSIFFADTLSKIRKGIITEDVKSVLELRKNAVLENNTGIEPTELYATNIDVNMFNEEKLVDLKQPIYKYKAYDYDQNQKTVKDAIEDSIILENELNIAIGAQVILIKTINPKKDLINGSRGVVLSHTNKVITIRLYNGQIHPIIPVEMPILTDHGYATRRQFPLKLAWALTIHRTQGMSLDCVKCDLSNVFEYGHAYVALSRVRNIETLCIKGINYNKFKVDPKVVNFYKNI